MAGFSMFNQTTTTTTPFATPSLNTTTAFGVTQPQQNISFGSTSTPAFDSTSSSNTSAFGAGKPQFGLPGTSLFGSSNTPSTQSGLTFGSSVQSSNLAQTQTKPTFGGLGFGSTPTTLTFGTAPAASQPSLTFGTTPATSQPGLTFGTTLATSQPGLTFGTTPATSLPGLTFGTTTGTSQPGLTFGSASTTPQTGLTFGSTPTTSQTGLTFGSTPVTSQTGLSFGSISAPQTGLTFGSTSTTSRAGISFGSTPITSQPSISFGSAPTTSQPSVSLGSGTTTQPVISFDLPTTVSQTGSTSSAPVSSTSAPQTGITFGTPASTASTTQTGLSFGIPSAPTQTETFGAPVATTAQTDISFGLSSTNTTSLTQTPTLGVATTATQGLSFGAAASTNLPTLSFGTGSTSSTTASTSAPTLFTGLASSTTASSSAAPSLFGNLTSTVTTSNTTTSGSIFSWQKPTTDNSATVPSSGRTSIGLGGVDHSAIATTQSSANTVTSVKEQPLPNEIQQTVVAFKEYVKTQKNLSSEVARSSAEQLTKLTQQISSVNNLIINLGSVLSQQKFTVEKIKLETIKSLNDYELVQKIKDSPVASEERLFSIRKYFTEKISSFEESTKILQEKIEYVYQHVSTLPQENSLSAEALKMIVKKLHDSFVVIGARAHKLHNDMQLLKVQYMTLRNQYFKDNSSISFSLNKELELPIETSTKSSDLALEGPNPFSRTGNGSFNSLLLTSQNRSFAASGSNAIGGLLNTSKPFGFSDISGVSLFDQSTSPGITSGQQFSLQKPPLGNKRWKK